MDAPHSAHVKAWAGHHARQLSHKAIADGYKPQALHEYTDQHGAVTYWRIRLKNPDTANKWIRPMRREVCDNSRPEFFTLKEPDFHNGKPLYRLHDLTARKHEPVLIVEGEPCADALAKLGLLATTSGAADSAQKADWSILAGGIATVWPDNDEAGHRYGQAVKEKLEAIGCTVAVIDVDKLALPDKGDFVDWLQMHAGATAADILALAKIDPAEWVRSEHQPGLGNALMGGAEGRIAYRRASDIQAKPIRWLWQGRIARGKVSMLAGNPGLGKSQVTVSIAAVVSTGGTWPVDRKCCERGNVIFLSAEDDPADTIRPRLEAAGADLSRVFILDAVVEGYTADGGEVARAFNLQADLGRLSALLAQIGDVALIVIDPVTAYLGGADSHKNAEIRALLSPLSDLAAKHGAAVVCVSHLNKTGGGEALLRVTGSMAFVAAARAAFIVAKDQENEARRLFLPLKNNIGNDQTGLAFTLQSAQVDSPAGPIETSCVIWGVDAVTVTADEAMILQGNTEERSAVEDARQFLLGLLTDGPVLSKQIRADAEGAGYSWRTIQRAQKALGIEAVKEGMKGPWVWRLAGQSEREECQETLKNDTQITWKPSHSSGGVGDLRQASVGDSDPVEGEL